MHYGYAIGIFVILCIVTIVFVIFMPSDNAFLLEDKLNAKQILSWIPEINIELNDINELWDPFNEDNSELWQSLSIGEFGKTGEIINKIPVIYTLITQIPNLLVAKLIRIPPSREKISAENTEYLSENSILYLIPLQLSAQKKNILRINDCEIYIKENKILVLDAEKKYNFSNSHYTKPSIFMGLWVKKI